MLILSKSSSMLKNIPLDMHPHEASYMKLRVGWVLDHEQQGLEHNYQLSKRAIKYRICYCLVKHHRFASGSMNQLGAISVGEAAAAGLTKFAGHCLFHAGQDLHFLYMYNTYAITMSGWEIASKVESVPCLTWFVLSFFRK